MIKKIDTNFIDADLKQGNLVLSVEDNNNYMKAKKEIYKIISNYRTYAPIYFYFIENFKIYIDKITGEIKFSIVGEEIKSNKITEEIKSNKITEEIKSKLDRKSVV